MTSTNEYSETNGYDYIDEDIKDEDEDIKDKAIWHLNDPEEIKEILRMKQKEYFKNWYDKNIKGKNKRVVCECGTEISYMNLCNHKKNSKKHFKLLYLKKYGTV